MQKIKKRREHNVKEDWEKFFEKYLNLRHCNDIEIHSLPNTKRLKVYVMPTQIAQRNVR